MVKIPHGRSSISIDLFKAMLQWLANCSIKNRTIFYFALFKTCHKYAC